MTIDHRLLHDLAPTGILRASLNLANTVLARSNTAMVRPAGVTIDLSTELARRLGVGVQYLEWETPGDSVRALAEGAADIGFLAVDPKRAEQVFFTAPYVQIDACYLVREDSPVKAQAEVDQPGMEVLVMETSAYDLHLTRALRHAKLVRLPAAEVLPALRDDSTGLRVAAGIKQSLMDDMRCCPGMRLLDGCFLAIEQAMVLPRSCGPKARAAVSVFLKEMVDSGFIADSLARHRISGAAVLPIPNRTGATIDEQTHLRLHPELAERVMRMQRAATRPAHLQSPAEVRAAFLSARQPLQRRPVPLDIEDIEIAGTGGPLRLRTYVPREQRPLAVLAYFHGGGFTSGDLDSHDAIACALALEAHCAVASVDYRVLPEHPFPAAFHDALSALKWMPGWASSLGLPASRIAAGGDSSGANLALAATLELQGGSRPCALWLAYPFIGADFDTPSHRENADAPLLTRARCERILADYAGRPLSPHDWRMAPLLSDDLAGLPPVVAIAAELDPLRSDAEILLSRLAPEASSVLVRAVGMPHGFLRWITDSPACAKVASESLAALRALLG